MFLFNFLSFQVCEDFEHNFRGRPVFWVWVATVVVNERAKLWTELCEVRGDVRDGSRGDMEVIS